jgi:phosphate transport system substrate-binding protein
MKAIGRGLVALAVLAAVGCGGGKEEKQVPVPAAKVVIVVSGSNTTTPILELLSKEFSKSRPEVSFDYLPSSHTAGGIQGAQSGELDLGATSRYVDATEKKLGLVEFEFARDGMVFVTNQATKVAGITAAQLKEIYAGKITKWSQVGVSGLKDDDMVVIDRPWHTSAKIVLMEQLFGEKFVFGPKLVMVERALDTNEALIRTSNSLGYTSLGAIVMEKLPLNLLKVDGVEPTPDNIKSGKFPYYRPMAVVYKQAPKPAVLDFVAFVKGPEGRRIIEANGFIPVP